LSGNSCPEIHVDLLSVRLKLLLHEPIRLHEAVFLLFELAIDFRELVLETRDVALIRVDRLRTLLDLVRVISIFIREFLDLVFFLDNGITDRRMQRFLKICLFRRRGSRQSS